MTHAICSPNLDTIVGTVDFLSIKVIRGVNDCTNPFETRLVGRGRMHMLEADVLDSEEIIVKRKMEMTPIKLGKGEPNIMRVLVIGGFDAFKFLRDVVSKIKLDPTLVGQSLEMVFIRDEDLDPYGPDSSPGLFGPVYREMCKRINPWPTYNIAAVKLELTDKRKVSLTFNWYQGVTIKNGL